MTEEQIEKLAIDFLKLCHRKHLDRDMYVYANNRRFSTDRAYHDKDEPIKRVDVSKTFSYFVEENKNKKDYDEYAKGIIMFSSEGEYYDMYNYGTEPKKWRAIEEFFDKHNVWYECDYHYAWSLYEK